MRWLTCLTAIIVVGSVASAADKTPRVVECSPNALILRQTGEHVTWDQLQQPGNPFEKLLDRIATNKTKQYLALLVRPGSRQFFRTARKTAMDRSIDVGYDVDEPIGSPMPKRSRFGFPPEDQAGDKKPVFFECRSNQVFFIDRDGLEKQVKQSLATLEPGKMAEGPAAFARIVTNEVGNKTYKVLLGYLLNFTVALEPKLGVMGDGPDQLKLPDCRYRVVLSKFNEQTHFVIFLVRDDSFPVFRKVRGITEKNRFEIYWELLAPDELIKFATGGALVPAN